MKRLPAALAIALLAGSALLAEPPDLRSKVLLDLDCRSDIGRRRATLFGNGTVRVRLLEGEQETMLLGELAPDELRAYLNRLNEIDLDEAESSRYGASGEWVEQCLLVLELDDQPERRFRFGRFDSLSLGLSRSVKIAEEIAAEAEDQAVAANFPKGYEPSPGDVLERKDGLLFEVVAFTADGLGVELRGVDQPLLIYVSREEIVGEFVELVESSEEWESESGEEESGY